MFYLTMHSTHFILRLYGVKHIVTDHSDRIAHTTAFVTPVVEHWLEQEMQKKKNLTVHSTHFIYGYQAYDKELLSKRGNPLPSHGQLFLLYEPS